MDTTETKSCLLCHGDGILQNIYERGLETIKIA